MAPYFYWEVWSFFVLPQMNYRPILVVLLPQQQSYHVHVAIELHLFPTPQESWKTFHHKRLGLEQKGGVDT